MEEQQRRILSTKLLPQQLIDKAANAGLAMDCVPFISTSPIIAEDLIEELKSTASGVQHIVFTSARAVTAVADQLIQIPSQWLVYCVSGATQQEVKARFPAVRIAATADDAAALAKHIKAIGDVKSVTFFCGDIVLPTLEDVLEPGIAIKRITVYKTALTPVKAAEDYEALLFFSPSAIDSYLSLNHIHPDAVLFTIGKTTASRLKDYPNKIITCHTPDANSMVQQVVEYYLPVKAGASTSL